MGETRSPTLARWYRGSRAMRDLRRPSLRFLNLALTNRALSRFRASIAGGCHSVQVAHLLSQMCSSLRKEVIQPHLPVRLPCYDFTPLTRHTFGSAPLAVRQLTSGTPNSGGVTGGVYKARERIHRDVLIHDY